MANLTIGNKSADSSYSLLLDANLKVLNSQAEEVDLISTAASVASDSLARLQAASVYTVYNAIPSWARSSTKPTYTAAEVGAVPTSRTVNGQSLNSNVTLTAANVGAVPTSRKVNNYSINEDVTIQATDIPFTPTQDISATNVQDAIAELINGSEYEYTIHSNTASLYHESYKFANGILIENIHSINTVVTSSWNQSGGIYYIMYQPIAFANEFIRTPTAQISARGSAGNVNAWAWFYGGVTPTSTGNFFVGRGNNTATGTIVVMITAIGRWTEEINSTISVSSGGTSTSNYNDLTNKPQVNGNTLTGNKDGSTLGLVDLNQDATNSGKILAVGSDGIVAPTSTINGDLTVSGKFYNRDQIYNGSTTALSTGDYTLSNNISNYQYLEIWAGFNGREDVKIVPVRSGTSFSIRMLNLSDETSTFLTVVEMGLSFSGTTMTIGHTGYWNWTGVATSAATMSQGKTGIYIEKIYGVR